MAASSMTVTDHWSCEPAGQAWQTSPRLGSNSNNSEEFLDFKGNQNADPQFFQGVDFCQGDFLNCSKDVFEFFQGIFIFMFVFSGKNRGTVCTLSVPSILNGKIVVVFG